MTQTQTHGSQRDSLLSSSITVSAYLAMEKSKDRSNISRFIRERFHERYVAPFDGNHRKNGFIMMASACLMVEAMESFWNGWKKSPKSSDAFKQFFCREERFLSLHEYAQEFYEHVRCGILHQGETTGGWHIRRDLGILFDDSTKTIDATVFLSAMDCSLTDYVQRLSNASWGCDEWKKFRRKMKSLCANTAIKV